MIAIRRAQQGDIEALLSIDPLAGTDNRRRGSIIKSVAEGNLFVAVSATIIIGYFVLEHTFFARGFISLLYVHSAYRRCGVGSALIGYTEKSCQTERIYTSTNQSNFPAQRLFAKLGYKPCGIINDLDPGDPEIIYSKELKR